MEQAASKIRKNLFPQLTNLSHRTAPSNDPRPPRPSNVQRLQIFFVPINSSQRLDFSNEGDSFLHLSCRFRPRLHLLLRRVYGVYGGGFLHRDSQRRREQDLDQFGRADTAVRDGHLPSGSVLRQVCVLPHAGERARLVEDELTLLLTLFRSSQTVFTIGYGDSVVPSSGNIWEMLFSCLCMLFGVFGYGLIIANMTSVIANMDVVSMRHRHEMDELAKWMIVRSVPEDLRERVNLFYHYMWRKQYGMLDQDLFHDLPGGLKTEVSHMCLVSLFVVCHTLSEPIFEIFEVGNYLGCFGGETPPPPPFTLRSTFRCARLMDAAPPSLQLGRRNGRSFARCARSRHTHITKLIYSFPAATLFGDQLPKQGSVLQPED